MSNNFSSFFYDIDFLSSLLYRYVYLLIMHNSGDFQQQNWTNGKGCPYLPHYLLKCVLGHNLNKI